MTLGAFTNELSESPRKMAGSAEAILFRELGNAQIGVAKVSFYGIDFFGKYGSGRANSFVIDDIDTGRPLTEE